MRNLYLTNRLFLLLGIVLTMFCLAFVYPVLFLFSKYALVVAAALVAIDMLWVFARRTMIKAKRETQPLLSLGDDNKISLNIKNMSGMGWQYRILDEVPNQFQLRDFKIEGFIKANETQRLSYMLRPVERGEYHFHNINIFIRSYLGLVSRRLVIPDAMMVPVYPSVIQMKKFELYTLSNISRFYGIKKLRRIAVSYEFEQIKEYSRGDDVRQINWKATGRHNSLMVNQFEDERSQPIYSIIDKSRIMRMPFNQLSLMDYAINTSLVLSNVALQKSDKAGLITFSDKIGATIKADRSPRQLKMILEALYNQKERDSESNYELLYHGINNLIKGRSLVFLYTNFESLYALKRVLPILRRINRQHLLVVMFFENSELSDFVQSDITDLKGIYTQTLAEQFLSDKRLIAKELNNYGIQTILTKPEDLSVNTVNKYLEMKARGMI